MNVPEKMTKTANRKLPTGGSGTAPPKDRGRQHKGAMSETLKAINAPLLATLRAPRPPVVVCWVYGGELFWEWPE